MFRFVVIVLWLVSSCLFTVVAAELLDDNHGVAVKIPGNIKDNKDNDDWVMLTSGEWLKGELIVLYQEVLEFDSDKLGMLNIKWSNVARVHSKRNHIIRFIGRPPFIGTLNLNETHATIRLSGSQVLRTFTRDELMTIATGSGNEVDFWSSKVSVGLNLRKGNTEQVEFNTIANAKRRTTFSRLSFDYLGSVTVNDEERTVDNHRLNSSFNWFLNHDFFATPLFFELHRDPFQNIRSRYTVGSGLGYTIVDDSITEWDITADIAYQSTQFDSVPEGEDSSESTPSLIFGTSFEHEISNKTDFKVSYRLQWMNDASGTYTHHMLSTLSTELTKRVDLDLSLIWDRTQNPRADEDGIVPLRDDYQLLIGFGFDF